MTSCPEAMGWEFGDFEKDVSWDSALGRASPDGGYGMHSAFVGADSTVSIVKIVCLSLLVSKTKVKKLINVSYLNNGESSVFRISLHQYILHLSLCWKQVFPITRSRLMLFLLMLPISCKRRHHQKSKFFICVRFRSPKSKILSSARKPMINSFN